ncbi:redoxin domain-containing protein [Persephonella sp.]|uniref:redoxin domain-containing protein n=1 Tax=Persephonella sp. TaxID=2060922 RepID=UPI00260D6955|nr:redoxin domain-containing protein [Persephonella sp.]
MKGKITLERRFKMRKVIMAFLTVFSLSFAFDNTLVGKEFRDFTSIDESGKVVKASQVIDHKPAVIIFFAIGDQPGTFKFLPHMNELYDKYKDKVVFMAVLLSRSDKKEVQELKKLLPLKIPVYRGYRDAIENYKIRKVDVPLIILVDKDGLITNIVARPESEMEEVYPFEKNLKKENTLEGRTAQSIKLLDKYIQKLIQE